MICKICHCLYQMCYSLRIIWIDSFHMQLLFLTNLFSLALFPNRLLPPTGGLLCNSRARHSVAVFIKDCCTCGPKVASAYDYSWSTNQIEPLCYTDQNHYLSDLITESEAIQLALSLSHVITISAAAIVLIYFQAFSTFSGDLKIFAVVYVCLLPHRRPENTLLLYSYSARVDDVMQYCAHVLYIIPVSSL